MYYSPPTNNGGQFSLWGDSMQFIFYKFNKRTNSTKVPAISGANAVPYISVTGKINDMYTNVVKPNITVPVNVKSGDEIITPNYHEYNFVSIVQYTRLYWIRDWTYNGDGTYTAHCEEDVLGSYKSEILNSNAYISRTSNETLRDYYSIDSLYPARSNYIAKERTSTTDYLTSNPANGVFILGVVTTQSPHFGAIDYFAVTPTNFQILVQNMVRTATTDFTNSGDWTNFNLSSDILKSICSPLQYIKSCKWYPISNSKTNFVHNTQIYLGPWNSGAVGAVITSSNIEIMFEVHVKVPKFPSLTELDGATVSPLPPYASYSLVNTLLGTITLDPTIACTQVDEYGHNYFDGFTMVWRVNFVTDKAIVMIRNVNNPSIDAVEYDTSYTQTQAFTIAVDIPLAEVATQYLNVANSTIGAVTGAANAAIGVYSGNAFSVAQGLGGMFGGVLNAAAYAMNPATSTFGNPNGGFDSNIGIFRVVAKYTPIITPDPERFGYVCNRSMDISAVLVGTTLPVYIQCTDPHITTSERVLLKDELDILIEMLTKGAYIE